MSSIRIRVGAFSFTAELLSELAPRTCAAFLSRLPFEAHLIHARWSGEAGWVPLGDLDLGVSYENATSFPAAGHVLWHPPGLSEAELLVTYGSCRFASRVGQLAGNHFLTITHEEGKLALMGRQLLISGRQAIRFELSE